LRLYVDGARDAVVSLTGGPAGVLKDDDGAPDPFIIGAHRQGGSSTLTHQFNGSIADVAYYSRALSDADMQTLRLSAAPVCTPVVLPTLSIGNVTRAEGNGGTTPFTFPVT